VCLVTALRPQAEAMADYLATTNERFDRRRFVDRLNRRRARTEPFPAGRRFQAGGKGWRCL